MDNPQKKSDRNTEMLSDYLDGWGFAELAAKYHMTRGCVHQTLEKYGGKGVFTMCNMQVGNHVEYAKPKLRLVHAKDIRRFSDLRIPYWECYWERVAFRRAIHEAGFTIHDFIVRDH